MTERNVSYYPYASFTNAQLPLLKVAALYFDKLYVLDLVDASWASVGANAYAREAVMQLHDAGILQMVTPAEVLTKGGGRLGPGASRRNCVLSGNDPEEVRSYSEVAREYSAFAERGQVCEGYGGDVEYPYADFPLALGKRS